MLPLTVFAKRSSRACEARETSSTLSGTLMAKRGSFSRRRLIRLVGRAEPARRDYLLNRVKRESSFDFLGYSYLCRFVFSDFHRHHFLRAITNNHSLFALSHSPGKYRGTGNAQSCREGDGGTCESGSGEWTFWTWISGQLSCTRTRTGIERA